MIFNFPKASRLLTKHDFQQAFKRAQKLQNHLYRLYWSPNSNAPPRLGVTVAKKNIAKAVHRNTIKRIIRESFRHQCPNLPPVDVIVMVKAPARDCHKEVLRHEIDRLWKKLCVKAKARTV